jgi:hypothetical protein
LSRIIWTKGGAQRDWRAEYFPHARVRWEPQQLFAPILQRGLAHCPGRRVGVAVDDTRLRKSGRLIRPAFYQHDPLSPPFHTHLMLGLRFLQASLRVPLYRRSSISCRALPIQFEQVSVVKRPRRKAARKQPANGPDQANPEDQALAEEWKRYRAQVKQHNLSRRFTDLMGKLRQALDAAGGRLKTLVLAGDGSFANRTVFAAARDRTELVVRCRKDAVPCRRAASGLRRFYDATKFTPEQGRQNDDLPWQSAKPFYGGKRRKIRFKEVPQVYWQGGARRLPLRLLVVAPTPYRKRKSGKLYYRQPAYLLTTDLTSPAKLLLQIYFDRWEIEVNHREEKDTLGVGQAQLWNPISVPKQPVLTVAAYSALLLASLEALGSERGTAYAPLPKW